MGPDRLSVSVPGAPEARTAERASVALLIDDARGGLFVGSAVLVEVAHRFLVATAAHNLEGLRSRRWLRVLPRGRFRADPLTIRARSRGRWRGLDVGWIELEGRIVARRGLEFLRLVDLLPRGGDAGGPEGSGTLWVHGYTAHGIDPSTVRGSHFVLRSTTVESVAAGPDGALRDTVVRTDLAVAWPPPGRSVPPPAGLSGGALWEAGTAEVRGVVGIARSWDRQLGVLYCTRVEHWLERIHAEFPDLRTAIESARWA